MSDSRLTDRAEYGQHVPLACVNHPGLRWSTKNIAPIGCRTIFFNLHGELDMGPECDCTLGSLYVVEEK